MLLQGHKNLNETHYNANALNRNAAAHRGKPELPFILLIFPS